MQADHIRETVEFFSVHIPGADTFRKSCVGRQIVKKDLHAVTMQDSRHYLAYLARTDNAGSPVRTDPRPTSPFSAKLPSRVRLYAV